MPDDMIFYNKQSLQRGRRRSVRFDIRKPVEFCEIDPENTDVFFGTTKNMSDGGLLFTSPSYVPADSHVVFKVLQTKPARTISRALCRVVRVHKNPASDSLFDIACMVLQQYREHRLDDWTLLRSAARESLAALLSRPPDAPAASAPEEKAPASAVPPAAAPRKTLKPLFTCCSCGAPVEEEDHLCRACADRTVVYFDYDRRRLFSPGSRPAAAPRRAVSRTTAASGAAAPLQPGRVSALRVIQTLAQKGDPAALPYLTKALASSDADVVEAARAAIESIRRRSAPRA